MLGCCNSDESEKLKSFVIGKYAKPRCFKNINLLPYRYAHKKAWVTKTVCSHFLKGSDAEMRSAGRKVILLIGRCAAYPPNMPFLRNVKVVACTGVLQPPDLGIMKCMKPKYRKALV
jgi:hypothetical protein